MRSSSPTFLDHFGIFVVCGAALGLEILLTRILALMMWHHYTYVVIGVALLGFGAAGSWVTARGEPHDPVRRRLARAALGFAIATPLCYALITRVRFAPLAVGEHPEEGLSLLLIYGLIVVPFFFGGLVICEAIRSFRGHVGSVYFADLAGAAAGAVGAVALLEPLGGPGAIVAMAIAGAAGAVAFQWAAARESGSPGGRRPILAQVAYGVFLAGLVLPWARAGHLDPPLAPSKEAAGAFGLMARELTVWTPIARIDVTEPGRLRPTMGGAMPPDTPEMTVRALFQDGSAPTLFLEGGLPPEELSFLGEACAASGHLVLRERGRSGVEELVIGVGGGIDLLIGLHWKAAHITGAEINSTTIDLLRNHYSEFTGNLAARPEVELVNAEGRHFVRKTERTFDLIQLSGVDTYTALASGAYVLSESYLYTFEGVRDLLGRLRLGGVLSYSRIVFPKAPRETLRLVATGVEALESLGVEDPAKCVWVAGQGLWAAVLISPQPFEARVLEVLRAFCERNHYDVLYDPGAPHGNAFDDLVRRSPAQREAFYRSYPYRVRPATDDRPFFFNYFKWDWLRRTDAYRGHPYKVDYPVGTLCLLVTLAQTVLLGALLILYPVCRVQAPGKAVTAFCGFFYFAALGVGFITVEIVLMQQLVLFLGHPTYSVTTVLPAMLLFAGLGSLSVRPATRPGRRLAWLALVVPAAIAGAWWVATHALGGLLHWPFWVRVAVAVALIAPLAFVLGMAFPTGVRILEERAPALVPWAWAVNGFTTVLGSTLAVLLAMETGFSVTMLGMAPLYVLGIAALGLVAARRASGSPGEAGYTPAP